VIKGLLAHSKFIQKQSIGKISRNNNKGRGISKGNNERSHGKDKKGNSGH